MTRIEDLDQVLAFGEISEDLLFHKIEKYKVKDYILKSLEIGYEVADLYSVHDIFELYKINEIDIEYSQNNGNFYNVNFRAQFEWDKDNKSKVIIYKDSIKELANISGISEELSLKIHLCHEFFHYHELSNNTVVSEVLDPVVTVKFMNFKRKANISRCSEIAAHGFTKKILKLDCLPNFYDYKYLMNIGKIKDTYLDELADMYKNYCM